MPAEALGERFLELSEHGEEQACGSASRRSRLRSSRTREVAPDTEVSALLSDIRLKRVNAYSR